MKKVVIVGSGISGLSAAAVLASHNYDVTVIEKNDKPGGRINYFEHDGFTFDMGPSWYWMPEVFEQFYNRFGYKASDFYDLRRLDPGYQVIFGQDDALDISASYDELRTLFNRVEPGTAEKLDKFLDDAAYKYQVGMNEFVWKPSQSIFEFASLKILKSLFKLQLFNSISKEIQAVVSESRLRQILEFPVLFLGATPDDTPALYSLMNHADLKLGTWYPMGGMYKIAEAFYKIAKDQGVKFHFGKEVREVSYDKNTITKVIADDLSLDADLVVSNADYHFFDQKILSPQYRNYTPEYWDKRKMAPSSLLVFVSVDKKVKNLRHHNLFFDADFGHHAQLIYKTPDWPDKPLFYVCAPSVTDPSVAPEGKENLFFLVPLAPDLKDKEGGDLDNYFNHLVQRVEAYTGDSISDHITYKKYFGIKDFKGVYNSFKGNAYGLANTLFQTAFLKPKLKNKKLANLYYTGQLTTPGPGLPPSIISGQVVAQEIIDNH